jgi:hypothetical protein
LQQKGQDTVFQFEFYVWIRSFRRMISLGVRLSIFEYPGDVRRAVIHRL